MFNITYDHYCLAQLLPTVHTAHWAAPDQRLELVHDWIRQYGNKNIFDQKLTKSFWCHFVQCFNGYTQRFKVQSSTRCERSLNLSWLTFITQLLERENVKGGVKVGLPHFPSNNR